jgi:hypothetical protein
MLLLGVNLATNAKGQSLSPKVRVKATILIDPQQRIYG